jgi:hypothetical protein
MIHTFRHLIFTATRSLALAATSLALSLGMAEQAHAQQYGPRLFWLAPSGLQVFQIQGFHQETNTSFDTSIIYPNLDIDTNVMVFTYVPTISIGETSGQFVFSIPYAWVDVQATAGSRRISRNQLGLADLYTEFRVGLINASGLSPQEFVQYMAQENPRVQVRALVGAYIPTGDYSTDRVVNIGSNRWTIRGGIPVIIRLSDNWKPGNRTTLEIIPVVDFFTDNNSPALTDSPRFGAFVADRTSQNPMFRIEGHITQDLGEQFWVAFDSLYVVGGATYADGVGQDDQQSWLALGGTLGASIWQGGSLSVNGGGVVARNDSSPEGWQVRVIFTQAF